MKKIYVTVCALLALLASSSAFSDTAILPYRLVNPSSFLKDDLSLEYARLMAVATSVKKGMDIYSFTQLEMDLKSLSLNPKGLVTPDSLEVLGRLLNTDYILLGSLSKIPKGYKAESILYSVRSATITSKCNVSSSNLFELAEKEVGEIFYQIPDVQRRTGPESADAVILADLSFNVSSEWDSLKDGIKKFASAVSNSWSIDTMLHIIPASEGYEIRQEYLNISSSFRLVNVVDKLKPRSGGSPKNFKNCLMYAVNNIPWRSGADKTLLIISNVPMEDGQFLERYASAAKLKGITIYTISLGQLTSGSMDYLRQLSIIGKGTHTAAAYKQRIYNIDAKPIDLFFEGGRLFQSLIHDSRWQDGLFYGAGENKSWNSKRPVSYLDEIFYDPLKFRLKPSNIAEQYPLITQAKIINKDKIEDNIAFQMKKIGDASRKNSTGPRTEGNFGKAMLTDGKITMWINIATNDELQFFEKRQEAKFFFPLGVSVQANREDTYGIAFNPSYYITNLPNEYIPEMMKTGLKKIVDSPDEYMKAGLFRPPVWFIDVRVDMVERYNKIYDVRDGME